MNATEKQEQPFAPQLWVLLQKQLASRNRIVNWQSGRSITYDDLFGL